MHNFLALSSFYNSHLQKMEDFALSVLTERQQNNCATKTSLESFSKRKNQVLKLLKLNFLAKIRD